MDPNSWARIYSSFRRYQSRSDVYRGVEYERDDKLRPEFLCPFCAEDFNMVGLCCHIDEEHATETTNGVCPVCAKRVGLDLVCHLTVQHGRSLKVQQRRRFLGGESKFSFSNSRKELGEGKLESLLGGSSFLVASSHDELDPLLTSFIFNPPVVDESPGVQPVSSIEASSITESTVEDLSDRVVQQSELSDQDQNEKAQRCKFVRGLLLSTFLDSNL